MYLKGVGPKRAELLQREAGIYTYEDLLHYYPRRYIDRSKPTLLHSLKEESDAVTVVGELGPFRMENRFKGKGILRGSLTDAAGGGAELVWFQGAKWIAEKYKPGMQVVLYGKPQFYKGAPQFTHPEMELLKAEDDALDALRIVPLYPSTDGLKRAGLDGRGLRKLLHTLLATKPAIHDFFTPEQCSQWQVAARAAALRAIHFPDSVKQQQQAAHRLKFEELLLFQLVLQQRKALTQTAHPAHPFEKIGEYFNRFYAEFLPFELTGAQKRVIKEIRADVAKPYQMNRLVQGDVGSGKTIVAVLAMLMALDNGYQATMMAPTEILAEQHYQSLLRYLHPLGIRTELITGSLTKAERTRAFGSLASGSSSIAVGTHALIEDPVQFRNLGLTIIDEQHKFGVLQRSKLWHKVKPVNGVPHYPHNLLMTATPIPRTLAMTLYGDVDVSTIDELPPGRKPIRTVMRTHANRLAMWGFLRQELAAGRQVYVVYPLVEESANTDLTDAINGFHQHEGFFKESRVGLLHGRLQADEKEEIMRRFKAHKLHILVSTTVIEVGVDVPNATVMVIEHADRFGLSQLHQLRGRVGRGGEQSYCILMTQSRPRDLALRRLQAMVETTDGFRLAQVDLEMRGPGDFLGTRQSGIPEFKLADLATDAPIVVAAREAAATLLRTNPELGAAENAALQRQVVAYRRKHNMDEIIA